MEDSRIVSILSKLPEDEVYDLTCWLRDNLCPRAEIDKVAINAGNLLTPEKQVLHRQERHAKAFVRTVHNILLENQRLASNDRILVHTALTREIAKVLGVNWHEK